MFLSVHHNSVALGTSPFNDRGPIMFYHYPLSIDDPALGLSWPLPLSVISDKDRAWRPYAVVELELRSRMRADGKGSP
jgi:dTDP-4-dehydrorhamnose 3,5-epimerase-like enzyme